MYHESLWLPHNHITQSILKTLNPIGSLYFVTVSSYDHDPKVKVRLLF